MKYLYYHEDSRRQVDSPSLFIYHSYDMKNFLSIPLLVCFMFAHAGQTCDTDIIPQDVLSDKIINTGYTLEKTAKKFGDNVYLIARVGQNLKEYGLHFSHMGILFKNNDNKWQVLHKLNTCGTDSSDVVIQDTLTFFADNMYKYDFGIFRLNKNFANRLHTSILNNAYSDTHIEKYNLVSYPWDATSQNSNEWVLDYLTKISMKRSYVQMSEIKAALRASSFKSSTLEIGTFKRLGARITKASVSFDDQPFGARMAGHIETTTVDSIVAYLSRESNTYCGDDYCNFYIIEEGNEK